MMRVLQLGITVLWLLMTWLLVRSEFGDLGTLGTSVPPDFIWRKMIESGDQSMLALTRGGATNRLGSFRWLPSAIESVASSNAVDVAQLPEGMAHGVLGYSLDFDGSFLLSEADHTSRVRVSSQLKTDAAGKWTGLHLQLGVKPDSWTVEVSAVERRVRIRSEGIHGAHDSTDTFEELASPSGWMSRVSTIPAFAVMAPFLGSLKNGSGKGMVEIDARKDHRLHFGKQTARCLRLKATLLGTHSVTLYINAQSGEVIRIELPEHIALINESFL